MDKEFKKISKMGSVLEILTFFEIFIFNAPKSSNIIIDILNVCKI